MPFKSDEQRKAFFAKQGNVRSATAPQMVKLNEKDNVKTVADVMSLNSKKGMLFFSPDTIKFFNSRVFGGELQGKNKDLFVTSEKRPAMEGETFSRMFTIRKVNKQTGDISTVGEFQQFGTQLKAKKFIKDKNL